MRLAPGVGGVQQPGFRAVAPGLAAVACNPAQGAVLDKAAVHGQGHRLGAAHHDRPAGPHAGAARQVGGLRGHSRQQGRGLWGRHGQQHGLVALGLGAVFGAVQQPAIARVRLQRLDGGLPLKAHRLRQGLQAAHQVGCRRGHAWGADKALHCAGLLREALPIVRADAGVPWGCGAGLLPVGNLGPEIGMACREVLGAVVALPIRRTIAAAARAHAARGATAFVEHVHAVACVGQGLGTGQACQAGTDDGDRGVFQGWGSCGAGHGCAGVGESVSVWSTQMKACVSMPRDWACATMRCNVARGNWVSRARIQA